MVLTANRRAKGGESSAAPPRHPRAGHPRLRVAFLAVAAVLSLALIGGSAVAISGIHYAENKVPILRTGPACSGENGCLTHVLPCSKDVCNFLILGSDSRSNLSKTEQSQYGGTSQVTGQRSDTIILVHQDFARNRTTVVSVPRDLRVAIPGHGIGKINSAFDYGPDVTVQTVSKLFGMTINHYIEIDFQGFINVVNAMGGVPICIDKPLVDTLAGLNLPHAGCYDLKGSQALAFVRARHIQGDAIPDFSRISRQQQFLRAALQKMQSPGQLSHVRSLIDALSSDFVRDKGLSLYTIKDLSAQLATVGQGNVDFRVVPSVPASAPIDGVDYVLLQQPDARKFFTSLRLGRSLGKLGQSFAFTPPSPAQITIKLYDAGSGGAVDQVRSFLEKAGFVVLAPETAPAGMTASEILYGAGTGQGKDESVVESYLPKVPPHYQAGSTSGNVIIVVIGPDFKGIG
jgi:LCP family protein required for cell wall assembly